MKKISIEKANIDYWKQTSCPKMLSIRSIIANFASGEFVKVFIYGEPGSGKTGIAETIHETCSNKDGKLNTINCASLIGADPNIAKSELFGAEQGAHSMAKETTKGLIELASNGTLFLDEVHHLPISIQANLLAVSQEGKFRRVGGKDDIDVKCNFVLATNRNIQELTAKGEFLSDLYDRFDEHFFSVVPLNERKSDIQLLVRHFFQKYHKIIESKYIYISEDEIKRIIRRLMKHDYSGKNIRLLEKIIKRSLNECQKGNSEENKYIFSRFDLRIPGQIIERASLSLPKKLEASVSIDDFYQYFQTNPQEKQLARAYFESWFEYHKINDPDSLIQQLESLKSRRKNSTLTKNKFNKLISKPGKNTCGVGFIDRRIEEIKIYKAKSMKVQDIQSLIPKDLFEVFDIKKFIEYYGSNDEYRYTAGYAFKILIEHHKEKDRKGLKDIFDSLQKGKNLNTSNLYELIKEKGIKSTKEDYFSKLSISLTRFS